MPSRNPNLVTMLRATVRVADGSGVVVKGPGGPVVATAAHVVSEGSIHTVRRGSLFGECTVLARDEELDVAVLTAPPQLDGVALALSDHATDAHAGDPIWAAGFPRGWNGSEPLVSPGTIAGIGDENWVNLDGTWGNSGGPLCIIDERPIVVGLILGKAGSPSADLEEFIERVDRVATAMEELQALNDAQAEDPTYGIAEVVPAFFDSQEPGKLALQAKGIVDVAELLRDHFRTGFLRFATATQIRRLLV